MDNINKDRLDECKKASKCLVFAIPDAPVHKDVKELFDYLIAEVEGTRKLDEEMREKLASLCHDQRAGWMKYLFNKGKFNKDGTFTIEKYAVDRWVRQMTDHYLLLSEDEKDSDRKEADKFIALMEIGK